MSVSNIAMGKVCGEWLNMKRLTVKQSTYSRYYCIVTKHIIPNLGTQPFEQLNSSVINSFIYEKQVHGQLTNGGPLSSKTVRDICQVLKSIVKYGENEYQIVHLADNAVLPKRKKTTAEVLTEKELRQIEGFLWENKTEARSVGLLLCMYTGIRLGEICALKWKDIDFKKKVIYINHTLQRITVPDQKGNHKTSVIIDEPKSVSSFRIIPIPRIIYPIIKELRGTADKNSFFLTSSPRYVEPRNYQYYFKRVLKKAEIRQVNFHMLRHTFATRCVEVGMDVKTLSEILGHSNTNVTLSYYVHSSLETKRKQINLLKL